MIQLLSHIFSFAFYLVSADSPPDYVHQQRNFEHRFVPAGPSIYNNDYIGIASFNIFVGIAVATVFGAGFFFDLFWPERYESPWVKKAWKASAVVVSIMALADALAFTVIVVLREAHFENIGVEEGMAVLSGMAGHNPPFGMFLSDGGVVRANGSAYKKYAKCVAALCLLWPAFVATVAA